MPPDGANVKLTLPSPIVALPATGIDIACAVCVFWFRGFGECFGFLGFLGGLGRLCESLWKYYILERWRSSGLLLLRCLMIIIILMIMNKNKKRFSLEVWGRSFNKAAQANKKKLSHCNNQRMCDATAPTASGASPLTHRECPQGLGG